MISLTLLVLTISATSVDAQRVRWCLFACEIEEAPAVDTLCTMQDRMITSMEDSKAIKGLPEALQRRIVKNETRYRCKCEKWQNPICGAPAK
jgi:predicted transcriptional regulator